MESFLLIYKAHTVLCISVWRSMKSFTTVVLMTESGPFSSKAKGFYRDKVLYWIICSHSVKINIILVETLVGLFRRSSIS